VAHEVYDAATPRSFSRGPVRGRSSPTGVRGRRAEVDQGEIEERPNRASQALFVVFEGHPFTGGDVGPEMTRCECGSPGAVHNAYALTKRASKTKRGSNSSCAPALWPLVLPN